MRRGERMLEHIALDTNDLDSDMDTTEYRPYAVHEDFQSTVWGLSDTDGDILERYNYTDPYGVSDSEDASASALGDYATEVYHRKRLHGGFVEKVSELYDFRSRWSDPLVGGWLSRDPLGQVESLNLTQYVRANPLSRTDPFGRYSVGSGGRRKCDVRTGADAHKGTCYFGVHSSRPPTTPPIILKHEKLCDFVNRTYLKSAQWRAANPNVAEYAEKLCNSGLRIEMECGSCKFPGSFDPSRNTIFIAQEQVIDAIYTHPETGQEEWQNCCCNCPGFDDLDTLFHEGVHAWDDIHGWAAYPDTGGHVDEADSDHYDSLGRSVGRCLTSTKADCNEADAKLFQHGLDRWGW